MILNARITITHKDVSLMPFALLLYSVTIVAAFVGNSILYVMFVLLTSVAAFSENFMSVINLVLVSENVHCTVAESPFKHLETNLF